MSTTTNNNKQQQSTIIVSKNFTTNDKGQQFQPTTVLINCSPHHPPHATNGPGLVLYYDKTSIPFDPFKLTPYTATSLYEPIPPSNIPYDSLVLQHWKNTGGAFARTNPVVAMLRTLHDSAMTTHALNLIVGQRVCAFFGGHALPRRSRAYRDAAVLGRTLCRAGMMVASGGGPGCMEAAMLGAYLAPRPDEDLDAAIHEMSTVADIYTDEHWISSAQSVLKRYPSSPPNNTLSIPTWFYGAEPTNVFASHICKFFDNAQREALLTQIVNHAAIFFPGSTGTASEIFAVLCENAYSIGRSTACAMVFYSDYWQTSMPAIPLVQALLAKRPSFQNSILTGTSDPTVIAKFVHNYNAPSPPQLSTL